MAERKRVPKKQNIVLIVGVFALGLIITVGSVVWGRSDSGQIDVSATITNSNQEQQNAGNTADTVQPVSETFANTPNGGLVAQPQSNTPPPPEPEPVASSTTATTTDAVEGEGAVASSTTAVESATPTEEPITSPETTENNGTQQ